MKPNVYKPNKYKPLSPKQLEIVWAYRAQKATELQTVGVFHTNLYRSNNNG